MYFFKLSLFVLVLWFQQNCAIIVKKWHENCMYTDECSDHRQVCDYMDESKVKVCICDSIHKWSTDFNQCIPIYNSTSLVELLEEKYNTTGRIDEEAKLIFMGALIAGLIVIAFSILCFIGVVLYCMHIRRRDRKLKGIVHRLRVQNAMAALKKTVTI